MFLTPHSSDSFIYDTTAYITKSICQEKKGKKKNIPKEPFWVVVAINVNFSKSIMSGWLVYTFQDPRF